MELWNWKPVLTTALTGLALLQELGQAALRGRLPSVRIPRSRMQRFRPLHRWGGILSTLLALALLGMGLFALFAGTYRPDSARGIVHVMLGSLVAAVLLAKVVVTNWLRRYLRHATALGIAALATILAVFLVFALPYYL